MDNIAAERLSASLLAMTAGHIATALGAPAGSVIIAPIPYPILTLF